MKTASEKRRKRILFALGIAGIVAIICLVVWLQISSKGLSTTEDQPSQTSEDPKDSVASDTSPARV